MVHLALFFSLSISVCVRSFSLEENLAIELGIFKDGKPDKKTVSDILHKLGFVLTIDFAIKMIHINIRRECHIPTILQGETGVGKVLCFVSFLSFFFCCFYYGLFLF